MVKSVEYELQVEEPSFHRSTYRRIAIITGTIVLACIVVIALAVTIPHSGNGDSTDVPYFAIDDKTVRNTTSYSLDQLEIPCIKGQTEGCADHRIVNCGTHTDATIIPHSTGTACKNTRIYVGEWYVVQFIGADKICREIKMQVGECWGNHPKSGNDYTCQGKCGVGCGNVDCGAWARDCLRHDVCSWYFTSSGGASDKDCGPAYNLAADDFLAGCPCTASDGKDKSVCKK